MLLGISPELFLLFSYTPIIMTKFGFRVLHNPIRVSGVEVAGLRTKRRCCLFQGRNFPGKCTAFPYKMHPLMSCVLAELLVSNVSDT